MEYMDEFDALTSVNSRSISTAESDSSTQTQPSNGITRTPIEENTKAVQEMTTTESPQTLKLAHATVLEEPRLGYWNIRGV